MNLMDSRWLIDFKIYHCKIVFHQVVRTEFDPEIPPYTHTRKFVFGGCCQTNDLKHQYLVDGYFYEITKERHSVRYPWE